jgi:hypothetical protein
MIIHDYVKEAIDLEIFLVVIPGLVLPIITMYAALVLN